MPQNDNEEEELVSSGFCPEDDHDIVRQPECDGVKQTFEEGKSMFSSSLSQNGESVTSDTITQESSLFACEALPTGNAQTGSDGFIVSESYYGPVPDQLPIDQSPVSQNSTSVDSNLSRSDSNLPQFVECSSDDTRVENENPFPSDGYSDLSSVTQNLAALNHVNVSVSCASDHDQSQSVSISCLAGDGDVCSITQDTSPPLLVPSPPLSDPTSVCPLSIPRHGPDLRPGPLIDTGTDPETLKAEIISYSFPRHGPDRRDDLFVSSDPDSHKALPLSHHWVRVMLAH